jgi:hypothetical protein
VPDWSEDAERTACRSFSFNKDAAGWPRRARASAKCLDGSGTGRYTRTRLQEGILTASFPSFPRVCIALCTWLQAGCGSGGSDLSGPNRVASIAIRPEMASLDLGQTLTLTPFLRDADGASVPDRDVAWSSSDPSIAVVALGRVTALRVGAVVITAAVDGSSGSARIAVRKPLLEVLITPESPTLAQGTFLQLIARLRGPGEDRLDDRVVSWTSSNSSLVAVSAGKVRGVRIGQAEIVATADGKTARTTVTVVPNLGGAAWTLSFVVRDEGGSVRCSGEGRLALQQTGPSFSGDLSQTRTCEAAGAIRQTSAQFLVEEGSVSAGHLDFTQVGPPRCSFSGVFGALPPTAASGTVSCREDLGGGEVALQGEWQMQR